ncbi:MAG: ATP-binding cassette domain-containing protein [Pseudomonadota bacterium]
MRPEKISHLAGTPGKRIAVTSGSNFDIFLDFVLKNEGLAEMPLERINMEPVDGQAAVIAGTVDATVPLATSRKLIFDARPDTSLIADGSTMPIEQCPSIMDVLMTTQEYMEVNEAALIEVVGAFNDKAIGMLREDNAAVIEHMIVWQGEIGRAGVKAADVDPILNGYFYFNTGKIKDVDTNGIPANALTVLEDIDLAFESGSLNAIVGTFGCGKSTLLKMMAGLYALSDGRITLDGEEIRGTSQKRGIVFQQDAVFP